MQYALLDAMAALRGRWSAMALAERLCATAGGTYGGRNPYRLLSTVHASLARLATAGSVEVRQERMDSGQARNTYTLTPKGRREAKR